MLFSEIFSGSAVSVDATERSLMANGGTTSGVPQAIDGARWYRLIAKFAGIVAADNFKFRVYRAPASGAAQEVIDEFHVSFAMSRQITYYWEARYDTDITVQRISANSRNLTWSIEACDQAPSVAEIQSGLATAAALDAVDNFVDTEVATLVTGVADIQARLPAALVSGRIDASVGAMAANVLTASALATDAREEIADQVWDEATAGHVAAGSTGEALTAGGGGGGATVDDILDEPLAGHAGAGTVGAALIASRDGVGTLTTAIDAVPTNGELATALAPLALSTQVDTVEASLATLATAVGDVPTNAELATALDPIATAAEVTAAVAPLATSAEVSALDAVVDAVEAALLAAIDAVPTNAELATAVAPLATSAGVTSATAPLATAANLATVAGYIDTEITTIIANLAAVAAAIAALSIPTAAQVRDAILDYSHGTGVIVRGLLERLETLAAGRWTGLRGATATGYARDGVTPVVEMAQNVPLGTREQWPGSDV